jgi:hypothetical protein
MCKRRHWESAPAAATGKATPISRCPDFQAAPTHQPSSPPTGSVLFQGDA